MTTTQVEWIGSSCGRHGCYTFYKGFRINSSGKEKNYCLGEFYFVRNSKDKPICIAEPQLIWHDATTDSKLASARLYFKPENTTFGRLSIHGENELLYAEQKVIIKCEDMLQWEYSGTEWTTGLRPPQESDFVATQETSINEFTGTSEQKYRLFKKPAQTMETPVDKVIIMTFQAYCRLQAMIKRLECGMTVSKSRLAALGGIMGTGQNTRVLFCRECFSCPELEKFHLARDNKAPILKGRPRKKKIRNSTLAKELKRKRFLADLERVKNNLSSKKLKLSESEEGTESDLSEESTKSSESMDEVDQPRVKVETPIDRVKPPNGVCPVSIKQVVMVMNDKAKAPPPLIPTTKLKGVVTSPPPLQKITIKTEVPVVTKLDSGPPPLCPITKKIDSLIKASSSLQSRSSVPECSRTSHEEASLPLSTSKAYTVIKSIPKPESSSASISCKAEGTKSIEPFSSVDSKVVSEGRPIGIVKVDGKENFQDSNKTKKKRLRQPGSMKEFNEDVVDDDEKYFMRSLRDFMKSRDTPISKIPALGFKRVNLWTMYKTAQKLGGYEMVTTKRLWRQVYDALGGSTTITSAATYTRRHYERLLLPYERFVRGQLANSKKSTLPQTTKSIQQEPTKEQTINSTTNQTTLKTNPTVNSDRVSRVPISNAQTKESRDIKDIPGVTGTMSCNSLKSTVVKVKPNGALPSYSVSIQSTKKEGVTPSTVIVTKSVDVPVSTIHSSPTPIQRSSTAPVSKSATPVTQKRNVVTPDRPNVTQYSSHSTSNTPRTTPTSSQTLWKKTYVTANNVSSKNNPVTGKQEYVTKKQEYVTQNQEYVTQKQNYMMKKQEYVTQKQDHMAEKKDIVMQKKDYVTQKQEYVTQKKTAVTERHQTKELPSPTPKHSSQTNVQERQGTALHKTTAYSLLPEEPIRTRSSKLDDQDTLHINNTNTKYLTISETYDLIHAKSRKRSLGDDKETTKKPEKQPVQNQDYATRSNAIEPVTKRRKTPSPCLATTQRHYVSHADLSRNTADLSRNTADLSRNTADLSRNTANTDSLSRSTDSQISNQVSSVLHTAGGVTARSHEISKEPTVHVERRKSEITEQPKLHIVKPQPPKELVDLTEVDATTSSVIHRRTSPLYTKMTYSYNNHDLVADTTERTDPRHTSARHGLITHCKTPRDYRDETSQQNGHTTYAEKTLYKPDKQVEVERHHMNSEIQQRTLSQRTSVESPDAHFQEWRRRQGMSQYPAYITTNEPRRRPSITEQLHPQTPPLEHRYVYVQNDNGLHPQIIEEVPLIISSKPGLYYPDESFYAAVPFYHAGWPATGVTETLPFKGDAETLRNNNHLHGNSCVFMPTSQMFSSATPIAPISPPIINQGHMTAGPEGVHQHCLMTSPYQHKHMIVTQAPTRPLHSFT